MNLYHERSPILPQRKSVARKKITWLKRAPIIFIAVVSVMLFNSFSSNIDEQLEHTVELPSQEPDESTNTNQALALIPSDYEALPEGSWKTIKVNRGDSLSSIFANLNVPYTRLHNMISQKDLKKHLSNIKPGQELFFRLNENCTRNTELQCDLQEVKMLLPDSKVLHISVDNDATSHQTKPLDTQISYSAGIIKDSLYMSAARANLDDEIIVKLAQIFAWDIDFALDIRENDSFKILYEELFLDGKKVGNGDIIAAEFTNRGETFKAIRFLDKDQHAKYYTPEGLSMQKAFIRTPVKFTRISSYFRPERHHPVLHRIRAHKGVDYAAPVGTPVKAAGDGKVTFRGVKGGYGNFIMVQHGPKYVTAYAHLSRFHPKVRHGTQIKQGQIIGYVGMTGLATGPHLHYEFRVNGVHRDPLKVKLPDAAPIEKKYRAEFKLHANSMAALLDAQSNINIARLDG